MSKGPIVGVAAYHRDTGLCVSMPAPYRHHAVMHRLSRMGITPDRHREFKQGFIDADGKFLNRIAALQRVREIQQPLLSLTQSEVNGLFSEDVW